MADVLRIGGRDPDGDAQGLAVTEDGHLKVEQYGNMATVTIDDIAYPVRYELDNDGKMVLATYDSHPWGWDPGAEAKRVTPIITSETKPMPINKQSSELISYSGLITTSVSSNIIGFNANGEAWRDTTVLPIPVTGHDTFLLYVKNTQASGTLTIFRINLLLDAVTPMHQQNPINRLDINQTLSAGDDVWIMLDKLEGWITPILGFAPQFYSSLAEGSAYIKIVGR